MSRAAIAKLHITDPLLFDITNVIALPKAKRRTSHTSGAPVLCSISLVHITPYHSYITVDSKTTLQKVKHAVCTPFSCIDPGRATMGSGFLPHAQCSSNEEENNTAAGTRNVAERAGSAREG